MIEDIDFEEIRNLTKFLNSFGIYSIDGDTFANIAEVGIFTNGYYINLDVDGEKTSVYFQDVPKTRQKLVDNLSSYGFLLIHSENIPSSFQQTEEEEQCDCPACKEEDEKNKEFEDFAALSKVLK